MSASSIAAISNQACPSECLDEAMSTAEERSTKRDSIEIKPFTELDISEFTLKDKGKGKNGGHMAYPLLSGESIRFNLTPNEWLRTPFGFDVDSKFAVFSRRQGPRQGRRIRGIELAIGPRIRTGSF